MLDYFLFLYQINLFDEKVDPNRSTFRPLRQQVNDNQRKLGLVTFLAMAMSPVR